MSFQINPFDTKDFLEEARDRTTIQFEKDSAPVFDKFLQLIFLEAMEIQATKKDLMQLRSIETAEGAQLDIIGEIVGQPRTLIDVDLFTFFGFRGHWNADTYGDLNDAGVGSVWWDGESPTTGNITLNDELYRLLIKAKIAKNVTRATPEDVINFTNFVFSTNGSTITDEGGAKFNLLIGRVLTKQEVGLLRYINRTAGYEARLLPKPVGVGMEYGSFDYESFFAFQGIPNAKGYGSLGYTHYFDGEHLYDGQAVPSVFLDRDENGNLYGGKWASLHSDIEGVF